MKKGFGIILFSFLLISFKVFQIQISRLDFLTAIGKWKGTITYQPKANGFDTLYINRNGNFLNDYEVLSNKIVRTEYHEIVTVKNGIDGNDNKPAILKKTYFFNKDLLKIKKEVMFDTARSWMLRNEFSFSR